jgi:hypothetical protein
MGTAAIEHFVKSMEHEAIAAEGDKDLRILRLCKMVAAPEKSFSRLCDLRVRREQANSAAREVNQRSFANPG